jgi:hypothetical protein
MTFFFNNLLLIEFRYSVPDTTLVIPSSSTNSQLEAILKGLLEPTGLF